MLEPFLAQVMQKMSDKKKHRSRSNERNSQPLNKLNRVLKRAEELRESAKEGEQIGTNAKNDKVMLTDGEKRAPHFVQCKYAKIKYCR